VASWEKCLGTAVLVVVGMFVGIILLLMLVAKVTGTGLHVGGIALVDGRSIRTTSGAELTRGSSADPSCWARTLCLFDDPRDNLRKWYQGFYQPDDALFESVSSASALRAFNDAIEHGRRVLQADSWDQETRDTIKTLWPRCSVTELRYEITDKSGDRAWVRVTGDLIVASGFDQERVHLEDTVQMVRENGEWRFHCFERRFTSGLAKRLAEEILGPGFLECN